MTYYGAKELAASFRTVRKNTIQIAEEIPEDKYTFSPAAGTRAVGETLAHIAIIPRLQTQVHKVEHLSTLAGFNFPAVMMGLIAEQTKPRTKAELLTLLKEEGEAYASWLESLSDEFLAETVTYPEGMVPPVKTRFEMVMAPKEHEMHHRGQLMLIERMLGITPHLTRQMEAMMAAAAAAGQQK